MLVRLLQAFVKALPVKVVTRTVRHQNFVLHPTHVRVYHLIIAFVEVSAEEVVPHDVDKILHAVQPKIGNEYSIENEQGARTDLHRQRDSPPLYKRDVCDLWDKVCPKQDGQRRPNSQHGDI